MKLFRRSRKRSGCPKKNEKTFSRIPFSVFLAGRVGLRHLQIERSGEDSELRLERGAGGTGGGLGAGRSSLGALSEIDYHREERPVFGAVSLVERAGRRHLVDGSEECRSALTVGA